MKKSALKITGLLTFASAILLFQNCSKSFDSADLSSTLSGSKLSSSVIVPSPDNSADGTTITLPMPDNRVPSNGAASLRVYDASTGDGNKVVRIIQKIVGGGQGLRGCTGPMSTYNTACLKDSEYQLISNAWGASSYDASSDTYSADFDVSAQNWPFTSYYTRYILADGSRTEITFSPSVKVSIKLPRLQWVRTRSQACVGPTPSPAPIGEPCSVEGDSRTNACGTATCQPSTDY